MLEGRFRLRIRYRKQGRLRYLSHLELVHSQERMIRRAGLPFAVTEGFSPHMRSAFGPALAVGTAGNEEYIDLWMNRYVEPDQALRKLCEASVEDLMPTGAWYVDTHATSLVELLAISHYRIVIHAESITADALLRAARTLEDVGSFEVVKFKKGKKKKKVIDLGKLLYQPVHVRQDDEGLEIDLWTRSSNEGSLRPELYIGELADRCGHQLTIVSIERLAQYEETDTGLSRPKAPVPLPSS